MTEAYKGIPTADAERLGHEAFSVEVRKGGAKTFSEIGKDVTQLYSKIFGPILERYPFSPIPPDLALAVQTFDLAQRLQKPDAIVALLRKKKRPFPIVGFSYAIPQEIDCQTELGIKRKEYLALQAQTAEIGVTAIDPQEQEKHGWRILMNGLYGHIEEEGYKYIVRWSRTANGYDQKVRYHPGGQVTHDQEFYEPTHGMLRFTRIEI